MNLADDPGFALLRQRLAGRGLPDLDTYKERCLRRRLAVRMRACGVDTLEEYAAVVDRTPGELDRLLEAITINVTGFFRNPEVWTRLLELLGADAPSRLGQRTAWSAGCASGEEAWTLAMLLAESVPLQAMGLARRWSVDATDLDEPSLTTARAGRYRLAAAREAPARVLARWTRQEQDRIEVGPELRRWVRFIRHDMSRDPAPGSDYDVVACRNVLIYFTRELQERLFATYAAALRPGGYLVLGKVETLSGQALQRFETVDGRNRIYRRRRD